MVTSLDPDGGGVPSDNPTFTGTVTTEGLNVTTENCIFDTDTGIVASTIQTQGQQTLAATFNEVATVANENDVVTLFPAVKGIEVVVKNGGTNTLQIFPASGDDLGNGVDASILLSPSGSMCFFGFDATNWALFVDTQDEIVTINFIIDGGESTITTGIKGHLIVDFACEVLEWAIVADQSSSIVVDVNRATFANYPTTGSIAGTELPTISTSTKGEDRTLTSWSDIDAGDVLEFEVDSITDCQRVTVALKCRKK